MIRYIKTVQGMNNQASSDKSTESNAAPTYTGLINHHTRMARRGPKNTRAVKKQHIAFSFYE